MLSQWLWSFFSHAYWLRNSGFQCWKPGTVKCSPFKAWSRSECSLSVTAINDKLQSLCPLSLCPNYCLYAVTVGVAAGGAADAVNILRLSLHFFLSAHLYFFLRWLCVVDIKTQELTTFVFILPGSVCHSFSLPPAPTPFSIVHCRVVLCINLQKLVIACQPTGSPEDYAQVEGEGMEYRFCGEGLSKCRVRGGE